MPIAPHHDRAPGNHPSRQPKRAPGPSVGQPAAAPAPRHRRDLAAWVALGLVVATVLTVVARVSTGPPHDLAAGTLPHRRTSTTATTRPTLPDRADRRAGHGLESKATPPTSTNPAAPTVPTTTSSTTTTTTTTTSPRPSEPTSVIPSSVTAPVLSGVLRYPDDIATSIPFTSANGLASARASWRGGGTLEMTLGCGAAVTSGGGTHGISLVVAGRAGSCSVSIALGPEQHGTVAYTLDVQVPATGPAAATTR